ncbi:ribosome small subunit-dependent GTPase A [soil metagenome]
MDLVKLGWNSFFEKSFDELGSEQYYKARVAVQNRNNYSLFTESGEITGEISGKFRFQIENDFEGKTDIPAVGDWVYFKRVNNENRGIIDGVLKRKNKFSRKEAGEKTKEQVVAANVDVIFLMNSLNLDLNLRRIERYLTLILESDIKPVILLSKSDLSDNPEEAIENVRSIAMGFDVFSLSVKTGDGVDKLMSYFDGNKTIAMLGSSGVGKSSLINHLAGSELFITNDLSTYRDKGKHTTTFRELVMLESGGCIIDTPGMRELQLWEGSEGLNEAFDDIEELALKCKFSDCKHQNEPGCAIREAIENGTLETKRLVSYKKLQNEIKFFAAKLDKKKAEEEKKVRKKITKDQKNSYKNGSGKFRQ